MDNLIIKLVSFNEITAIKEIRKLVFQKEQGIKAALDFDGLDEMSEHLIACMNEEYLGTARIRYLQETAKIERLAVLPQARRKGIGKRIVEEALLIIQSKNISEVVIHAQNHLKLLYQQLGFVPVGDIFEEAGILHVKMKQIFK